MLKGRKLLSLLIVMVQFTMLFATSSGAATNRYNSETIAANAVYGCGRSFGGGLYDAASNKTFVTWSGPGMDIYVSEYDHQAESWGQSVKICDLNQTDTYAYHDYPTMVMLPDGKLGVFYANHVNSAYLVKAPNAGSIAGTWTRTQISDDNNAYPMPVVIGSDIYFYYSKNTGTATYRTYHYIKSSDNGSTWTSPTTIIDTGKTTDKLNEVYAWGVSEDDGKVYITWSMAGGSAHNAQTDHLYLAYHDTSAGTMHNVAGTNFGTQVDHGDLGSAVVEYVTKSSSGDYDQTHPIKSAGVEVVNGNVYVGFAELESGVKKLKFSKYESGSWNTTTVDTGIYDFRDIVQNSDGSVEMMYTRDNGATLKNVESTNGGTSWTEMNSQAIPTTNGADEARVANFIENRSTVSAVVSTIELATKKTDYSGSWPVFVLTSDSGSEPPVVEYPAIHSKSGEQVGGEAINIIDGDTADDSRWSSQTYPQWLIIDYGSDKTISGTKLWTYLDRAYQYKIWASSDLADVQNESASALVVDNSSNTSGAQPITNNFNAVTARYVKIKVSGASGYTGTWVSLTEFEIVEGSGGANTTTHNIVAAEDTFVRNGSYADDNYGTNTTLYVKSDGTNYRRKAYAKFDYSEIGSAQIQSAYLKVHVSAAGSDSRSIKVYGNDNESWSENTLTWNQAPTEDTYIGSFTANAATGVWYMVDVTEYITSGQADQLISLELINEGATSSQNHIKFDSREAASNQIQLEIITTD